jgi:atypical dual specificity phosphatase
MQPRVSRVYGEKWDPVVHFFHGPEDEYSVHRFYWLVKGDIAGCSLPGGAPAAGVQDSRRSQPDENLPALDADLAWLRRQGIGAVLSLTEEPLPVEALHRHQLEALHLPVPDMAAPTPDQFRAALDFVDLSRSRGQGVAVHCLMGQGRTGSVLAAYLIRNGVDAQDSVKQLRAICPGALSSPPQERALEAFSARRDWIL